MNCVDQGKFPIFISLLPLVYVSKFSFTSDHSCGDMVRGNYIGNTSSRFVWGCDNGWIHPSVFTEEYRHNCIHMVSC